MIITGQKDNLILKSARDFKHYLTYIKIPYLYFNETLLKLVC